MNATLVVLVETEADGTFTVYHLPAGVEVRHTDADGITTTYARDEAGRVRAVPLMPAPRSYREDVLQGLDQEGL